METEENPEGQQDLRQIDNTGRKEKLLSAELRMDTSPGEELSSPDWAHPVVGRGVPGREPRFKPENDPAKGSKESKGSRECRRSKESSKGLSRSRQSSAQSCTRNSEQRTSEQRTCERTSCGKTFGTSAESESESEWKTRKQCGSTFDPGNKRRPARIFSRAVNESPEESGRSPGLDSWKKAEPWKRKPPRQASEKENSFFGIQLGPERHRNPHSWKTSEPPRTRGAWQKVSSFPKSYKSEGKLNSPMFEALLREPKCYPDLFSLRGEKGNITDQERSLIAADNCLSSNQQAELLLQSFKEFLDLKAGRQPVLNEDTNSIQSEELMQTDSDLPDCNSMDCSLCCMEIPE